jgi:hypothetical protein
MTLKKGQRKRKYVAQAENCMRHAGVPLAGVNDNLLLQDVKEEKEEDAFDLSFSPSAPFSFISRRCRCFYEKCKLCVV